MSDSPAIKPRLLGINHVALEVGDIDEALAFYGRFFDFELRGRHGDEMAFIDLGDQFLALIAGREQPTDAERHFGLVVDDRESLRARLEAAGVEILIYSEPTEIMPSIWVTGPIKRTHEEKTYPTHIRMKVDGEWVEDYVPESQGLTIVTSDGPIVLLGCGHSGSVNLLEQVQRTIQDEPIQALMGGMHLFSANDETLDWTANKLTDIGIQHLMAGHCTGVEPLMRLRQGLNLDRKTAVVGAVGSRFVLGEGIHPTAIAQ